MSDTRIGKYAIENLTRSMYEDSRCIYREFIQNAADQIDESRTQHLDPYDYYDIQIFIDAENRRITVEDNATGVSKDKVAVLKDVACSQKKRGEHKGFRGIGRLGGLGYCSKLTFVTSFAGEDVKTIMRWDAEKIISIVDDEADDSEASAVIDACVSYETQAEEVDKHYFHVIMDGVKEDELLDAEAISNYLSMVAPVDYPTRFAQFGHKIKRYMSENGLSLDTYNLFVNGDQIYKGYTTRIIDKQGDYDIKDIQFFDQRDAEGNIIYWGWYSISEMKGQINAVNIPYGMRLRCKNIQIGDENTCKKFFRTDGDKRFAQYFYGEINVVAPYLQPDGRRDYFRPGKERIEFEKSLTAHFAMLKELCYEASTLRGAAKKVSTAVNGQTTIQKKKERGFVNEAEKQQNQQDYERYERDKAKYALQFQQKKAKMEQEGSPLSFMLQLLEQNTPGLSSSVQPQLSEAPAVPHETQQQEIAQTGLRTDGEIYAKYNNKEKKVINIVYGAVYEAIADAQIRDSLINRIEAALTKK